MPFAPEIPEDVTVEEIRSLLEEAGNYLLTIQQDGDRDVDSYQSDVRSAVDFIHTMDPVLTAFEASRAPAQRTPTISMSNGPVAATQQLQMQRDIRSIGTRIVEDERYQSWSRRGHDNREFPSIEVDGISFHRPEMRALLDHADSGSTGADVWSPVATPTLPPGSSGTRQRRLFVRDLLAVVQTTLQSVPYIRELNPVTNETGAATVAEGAAKPEVTMQFTQDDAPIRKIAAWVPATTEIFSDAPLLRGYVDTRLNYMLAIREEDQVLNGDGIAPNIRGILNTPGLQNQASIDNAAGLGNLNDVPATIGQAIGKVENVDGDADAVVMNPLDYWGAVTSRYANQFDNAFGGPSGAPAAAMSLTWGLPAIRTRAITQGTALVGAFGLGGTLLDRQRVTIRSSDSHDNFFVTNKIAVVAEERVGLAVHRPDFFVLADLLNDA